MGTLRGGSFRVRGALLRVLRGDTTKVNPKLVVWISKGRTSTVRYRTIETETEEHYLSGGAGSDTESVETQGEGGTECRYG